MEDDGARRPVIVLVGGEEEFRQRLANQIGSRYNFSVQRIPDEETDSQTIVWGVSDAERIEQLHERGAKIGCLSDESDDLGELAEFCSVTVDGSGEFRKVRSRLETALAGCC